MSVVTQWSKLPADERRARCRTLQALVRLLAGPPGQAIADLLRRAEIDVNLLPSIDAGMGKLPTLTQRRILLTYSNCLPLPAEWMKPATERQTEIDDEFRNGWRGR